MMQQIIQAVVVDQATAVLLFSMISSQVSFTLEREWQRGVIQTDGLDNEYRSPGRVDSLFGNAGDYR
ncbi:hypothetical protein EMIT07CA2_20469 [Brevibacillus sp. IT-7CA2]